MTPLEAKSKQNLEAAELLFNNRMYCPSIHCAYYSYLQLAKHFLIEFDKIDFEAKIQEYKRFDKKAGSHHIILKEVENKFRQVFPYDKKKRNKYTDKSVKLKVLREQSDYSTNTVSQEQSFAAKRQAEELQDLLKEVYK